MFRPPQIERAGGKARDTEHKNFQHKSSPQLCPFWRKGRATTRGEAQTAP